MAYIYKITNQINGKIYIGKTLKTIPERWKEHCRDYKRERCEKRPLYDAMNKYGIENFIIEEVEECSPDILNNREVYWIEQYGSFKYGYNATKGGDGKHYIDYDLIYSLYKEGKNQKEIVAIVNCSTDTVRYVLENNGIPKEERIRRSKESHSIPIAMLDKNTNEILKVFPSAGEAGRYLKKNVGNAHIIAVCKGKRKTAYGYSWKYLNK